MPEAPHDVSALALNIDRLMRRIHSELHPKAGDFDLYKVGPVGGMVMLTLADEQPVDAQFIANLLGRDKSQISRLLTRFETQGLIERQPSPSDGRAALLTLTKDGHRQVDLIRGALVATVGSMLEPLSTDEREAFGSALAKVIARTPD